MGAGWNQPPDDLINAFEPGDKRKAVSIGIWNGLDWDNKVKPIPYCAKYKASKGNFYQVWILVQLYSRVV